VLKEKIIMSDNLEFEVDGVVITTDDDLLDGRQVRAAARLSPPSDYVLIRVDGGIAQSVGLEEQVRLQRGRRAAFRSFASDRVNTLTVDERGWEWGSDLIGEADIRGIGQIPDDRDLFLDSDQDRTIPRGGTVALGNAGVERVRSRKARPRLVTILVNARAREVVPGPISFERLIELAFPEPPSGPQVSFTVSFRKGPPSRPEGSLLPGQSVDVVQGMTFHVTATDKS
jgi:hypothetical protein